MKLIKSKKAIVLLVLAIAAISAIGAYAYFTSSGYGHRLGVGRSIDGVHDRKRWCHRRAWTPAGGALTYESVKYRVTNPSSGHQNLVKVNISVAGTAVGGAATVYSAQADLGQPPAPRATSSSRWTAERNWAAAGSSVDDTATAANLAPGATSVDGTVMIRMIDTLATQDNCQLQTVPLHFAAS